MLIWLSLSVFVVQVCSPEGGEPEGVSPRVFPNIKRTDQHGNLSLHKQLFLFPHLCPVSYKRNIFMGTWEHITICLITFAQKFVYRWLKWKTKKKKKSTLAKKKAYVWRILKASWFSFVKCQSKWPIAKKKHWALRCTHICIYPQLINTNCK
jgi:hypothetical protein